MATFGEKLASLRTESQAKTAKRMGLSQAYLSNLENRERAPRQEVLEVLAAYYNKPITFFLNDMLQDDEAALASDWIKQRINSEWPMAHQEYDGPDW